MTGRAFGGLERIAVQERLVSLDNLASAAERRSEDAVLFGHRLADAVRQKPSGLHRALQHALHLTGADALFARAHQVDDLQPQMQRQVRAFEDGPLAHGELAAALTALVQPPASRLAADPIDSLASRMTVRADRSIRPQDGLDVRERGVFIGEAGLVENGACHGRNSLTPLYI